MTPLMTEHFNCLHIALRLVFWALLVERIVDQMVWFRVEHSLLVWTPDAFL